MKAVLMHSVGGPEVLKLQEVSEPRIKDPTDVLIRVMAAGVNPVDTKLRSQGTYYPDRLPTILGCDGAGIVQAVGNGCTRFKPGDEVYYCYGGIGWHPGNYAEFNVIDEKFLARKPKTLDFNEAAAAPLVLITAWESLYNRARLDMGHTVLIHGGGGGVGHVAIQLAKIAGAKVATTVSTAEKAQFARELGADHTIFYRRVNFVEDVLDWTGQAGVDVALDTVGADTFVKTLSAAKIYGDVVTLLQPPADCDWKTARIRNLRVGFELMLTPMYRGLPKAQQHQAEILNKCADLFDQGRLRIHIDRVFALEDAAAAHKMIMRAEGRGKLVLAIGQR